ncbi:colipase isoform X2 [Pseudopipra pipra]|uniref:colipase isoform X2 n=1 Tax=Pseudopipra pipra TaxID=415032 RepID=UPI003139D937
MANVVPVCLLLALMLLAPALSAQQERGLIFNLEIGELCLQSAQCKSGCCHRDSGLSMARCAPKAAEFQECTPKTIYGVYYKCPCESGLTCDADKTIVGSITNTNFGICKDPRGFYKESLHHQFTASSVVCPHNAQLCRHPQQRCPTPDLAKHSKKESVC